MLKTILVTCTLALTLGLIGCGKSDQEKALESGNKNIRALNDLASKLQAEGIAIQTVDTQENAVAFSKSVLSQKTSSQKEEVLNQLKSYAATAADVLKLDDDRHDGVKVPNPEFIRKNVQICRALIAELEGKSTSTTVRKAEAEKPAESKPSKATKETKPVKFQPIPGTHVA